MLPMDSPWTPTPRSAKPSLSKSPTPNMLPKKSPASAVLPTPGLSWVKNWLPVPVSPAALPYSTLTAPTSCRLLDSPAAPIARSAKPSLLKSPTPNALPKVSPASAVLPTPAVFWVKNWLPVPVDRWRSHRAR
jgi:hypothetical protein